MTVVVLRHIACEPAADYGEALASLAPVVTVDMGVDTLPDLGEVQAILSMGGPMGVGDADRLPWIREELDFLRRAVESDIPVWGVCLGAQMLAAALGAKVYTGEVPEVGVSEVILNEEGMEDPVWGGSTSTLNVLQWHSDTFDVPEGATLLASSSLYPNQLFRYGKSYAVQFHVEASPKLVSEWAEVPEYRDSLSAALGSEGQQILARGMERVGPQLHDHATSTMAAWSKLWL